MRNAKSAKARIALGATLIAIAIPVNASGTGVFVSGIDGGGINGIDGGGINGIDGGGINGIDGGGIAGIDGGGINGIDGGGINGIDGGGINGIDGGGILAGPGDKIDTVNGVFESMGQTVMASQGMLSGMRVGDYVSVEGSVVAPGWLYADDVSVSGTPYVEGATEVFVTGLLTSVDQKAGTAQLGGLTIDYTSSLGNGKAPEGAMWSFSGIRPAKGGVMISDRTADLR